MPGQIRGTIGILPAGALGVAFFHHLTRGGTQRAGVAFLERAGSGSGQDLRKSGRLLIRNEQETEAVEDHALWSGDVQTCLRSGRLPEILLVCPQPDQLLDVMTELVALLCTAHERMGIEAAVEVLPCTILASNGIYFQRVRQFLLEKLEEAILFGRVPDLWPTLMPRIIGKLLRGVTIQTGQREGSGVDAIYKPGPRGRTRIAGGDPQVRARCVELLTARGGWFENAEQATPTRVEFDKALVNLLVNLLGQLHAVDLDGSCRLLTVREVLAAAPEADLHELTAHVVEVGRAVHAYDAKDTPETALVATLASCRNHLDHIPSSLQYIDQRLRSGTLPPELTPTETWLLQPLIQYARGSGLEEAVAYFEKLTARIEQQLRRAIDAAAANSAGANRAKR